MRGQIIFAFAALAVTSIFTPQALGIPLFRRDAQSETLRNLINRDTTALDALNLPTDQFNALAASVLDNPTPLQADFVTDMVYEILGMTPPATVDGVISDDVKAAFLQMPIDQQRTIIEVAVGSAGLDSEMTSGSASSSSTATPTNATDGAIDNNAADLPVGATPGGQVTNANSTADMGNSTTLDLPVGSTDGSKLANSTNNSASSLSNHPDTQTTTSSLFVLNPKTTSTSLPASATAANVTESNTATTTITLTATATATLNSTTSTTSTNSKPPTTSTTLAAIPTSTEPVSYWYTRPNSTVALYLRCIDKDQADALVASLKAKQGVTEAEIEDTESQIAVYHVGPTWVKPDWCASESSSSGATVATSTTATASTAATTAAITASTDSLTSASSATSADSSAASATSTVV
ncbi:hypothetical protein FRB97_008128 [Tulasnella sp. 331]|nr:hypothetical protein FRB97_008128 [Tulasnella sp. 331]